MTGAALHSMLDLCCELSLVLPQFDNKVETMLDCAAELEIAKRKTDWKDRK